MPSSSHLSRRACSPLALVLSIAALGIASAASAQTASVSMSVPSAVAGATIVSHVNASTVLNGSISLAPADRASLEAFVNSVSDPKSSNYHQWLTPAQVGERFGLPTGTVNAVVSYLQGKGLTIRMVGDNRMAILFKGRADKIESAFSTRLNNYKAPTRTNGPKTFYSFATVPKVPVSFASKVVSVDGLDNANPPVPRTTQLTPAQARTLYSAAALYDTTGSLGGHKGEGVNIGISNFDGYRLSNLPLFYSSFGLPAPAGGVGSNVTKVTLGIDGETQGAAGEGDLDYQMVLGMAPKCSVYIYDGYGATLVETLSREVQDNVVDIVTESYGFRGGDSLYIAAHDQHLSMSAQGITYMCASGDYGTSELVKNGYPYPDFDPDVLLVGGSDATTDGSGNRLTEVGWNGSGGGYYPESISFNVLPTYQKGTGVPTNINHRLVPDMALHATAWYFVYGGAVNGVGGTSAATPSFAGQLGLILQALKEQNAVDPSPNGRFRLGRINDFIYSFGANDVDRDNDLFTDLVGGDIGRLPNGQEAVGKPDWDFVTGWGAPIDTEFYSAWLQNSAVAVPVAVTTASLYTTPSGLTLGANPAGGASNLAVKDGATYSASTVNQTGVGQVAAFKVAFALPNTNPRSAAFNVAMISPVSTTVFVYLYNVTTGAYDMVTVVAGNGATKTISIPLDLTKYMSGNSIQAIVRAERPRRLGSGPFRFMVDQAIVTERVPRG